MKPPTRPSHPVALRARFAAWVATILLLLPGQLVWLTLVCRPATHPHVLACGHLLLGAAALGVLALLRTTPPDAIRLTSRTSAALVVGGTLLLQATAVALSRHASAPPLPLRAAVSLLVVAAVAALVTAFRRSGESAWHAALLGWNPLLTLTTAHAAAPAPTLLALAFVAATLAATAVRRFKPAAVALALAARVEPLAALLLPFLWRRAHEERSFRAGRRVVLVFALGLIVAWLIPAVGPPAPAVSPAGTPDRPPAPGLVHDLASLVVRADRGVTGPPSAPAHHATRLLALPALLGMALLLWQSRATLAEAGYWLTIVMLLFAPAVHPWQVLWPLVFVPMLRGPQGFAALVWAATAPLGQDAAPSHGLWAAQSLPLLAVLVIEVSRLAAVVPLGRIVHAPQSPDLTPGSEREQ